MISNEKVDDLIEQMDKGITDCINKLETEVLKEDVDFDKARVSLQVGRLQHLYIQFRFLLESKKAL